MRIEISPNGKWLNIAGSSTPGWIYAPQPEDKFKCEGEYAPRLYGDSLRLGKDELMRLSHDNEELPLSPPNYQYRVRKIAYLDESSGKLVKTEAYDDMLKRSSEPFMPGYEP